MTRATCLQGRSKPMCANHQCFSIIYRSNKCVRIMNIVRNNLSLEIPSQYQSTNDDVPHIFPITYMFR